MGINDEPVGSREEFSRRPWQAGVDREVRVMVRRASGVRAIAVRPTDRCRVYRTSDN